MDIRNSLQVLYAVLDSSYPGELRPDFEAIRARLESALKKLDAAAEIEQWSTERQAAWLRNREAELARKFPPLHDLYREAQADGAALPGQPIPPLDYAVPSEEEE